MCLKGFEPPTPGLEGRCSIQLSYRHTCDTANICSIKAGDGNRTHVSSLEGWCSTIELHPHVVGVTGFEPATSWSQTRRSSQAEPHPDILLFVASFLLLSRSDLDIISSHFILVNTIFTFFCNLFFKGLTSRYLPVFSCYKYFLFHQITLDFIEETTFNVLLH